jgi:hypothetical protein
LLHLLIGELAYNQGLRTLHTSSIPFNTVEYLSRLLVHPFVNSPDRLALQIDLQDGRRKSFHLYMRCKQVNNFKDRLEGFLETHKDGPGSIKRHRQWNTAKSLLDLPYAEISKCMSMMRDRRSRACSVLLGHISRHICPDSVANLDEMHVYSRVFR